MIQTSPPQSPIPQSDELLRIDTPENVNFAYEVVGIGTRFIACIIDTGLLALALVVVNVVAFLLLDNLLEWAQAWVAGMAAILTFGLFWGYYIFFELMWNGQSPGKRWSGIRVIRRDGSPVTLTESIIRNLVRIVDFLPMGYGAGVITMFIHPQSCRLGDLAAGTLVVREQSELTLDDLGEQPLLRLLMTPGVEERVQHWPVERLGESDMALARAFLQRRHGLVDAHGLSAAILRRLLAKMERSEEEIGDMDHLSVLAAIVNARRAR